MVCTWEVDPKLEKMSIIKCYFFILTTVLCDFKILLWFYFPFHPIQVITYSTCHINRTYECIVLMCYLRLTKYCYSVLVRPSTLTLVY